MQMLILILIIAGFVLLVGFGVGMAVREHFRAKKRRAAQQGFVPGGPAAAQVPAEVCQAARYLKQTGREEAAVQEVLRATSLTPGEAEAYVRGL